MARRAVVAGQFYPAGRTELMAMIADCTPSAAGGAAALGALSPHAGYVFSGPTAGAVFARINIPPSVVLLTPSHRYLSPACALWSGGPWRTPLGEVGLDEELCRVLAELPMVTVDDHPHLGEHSGEVVVPFLQYHRPDVRLAVICVTPGATDADVIGLGQGVARAIEQCGRTECLVAASSDMSHEEGPRALDAVNRNDPLAIAEMQKLDPEGLMRVCRKHGITMCGVPAAAAMMSSVRARGGTKGELVRRATSADSPMGRGDYVVGYAGMVFS